MPSLFNLNLNKRCMSCSVRLSGFSLNALTRAEEDELIEQVIGDISRLFWLIFAHYENLVPALDTKKGMLY